jgi:hypothetical protein
VEESGFIFTGESPGICLERLRKTKKNVRNDDRVSSPSLNADLPNTNTKQGFNNANTIFANLILIKVRI